MDHSEIKHLPKVDHTPAWLDEASRILLNAAALLEERGWCQNSYNSGERLCALGAINRASTPDLSHRPRLDAEQRVERAVGSAVATWNDQPDRTMGEVVAKLRTVALLGR